jgi:hypothetical protein
MESQLKERSSSGGPASPAGTKLLAALALMFALLLAPALCAGQTKPLPALEGKLLATAGECPVLKTHDRQVPLSATTPYLYRTLQDKRLDGFEVRVEGTPKPDGSFEVEWLYTIHHGKLYRVRYFCAVCNLVGLGPGNCVCCQQPTELQEIPKDSAIESSGR